MAKNIDLSDLMTRHQAEQGTTTKAIVPEKVEREVEAAVDALSPEELEKVEQIKDSIDMTDSEALLTYGAPRRRRLRRSPTASSRRCARRTAARSANCSLAS